MSTRFHIITRGDAFFVRGWTTLCCCSSFSSLQTLETDYLPLRDRCLRSVADLNKVIIKNTISSVAMADGGDMFDQST